MIIIEKYELVKFIDNDLELDITISPEEENIWLSKNQISELFDRDRSVISKHIKKIFQDLECDFKSNVQKMHVANSDKLVEFYSLDVIIAVGFKTNSKRAITFRKWANKVLKEYLFTGYVINSERTVVTNENYVRLINKVESLDKRVSNIENNYIPQVFKISKLFFNGEFYDSYTLIQQIFENASSEIIIIDNYIDRSILDRLVVKGKNVKVLIYTNKSTCKLIDEDISKFNSQYGDLNIKYTKNVHDRYIIIDTNKLYYVGHSLKDLGKKIFLISKLESDFINVLIDKIIC